MGHRQGQFAAQLMGGAAALAFSALATMASAQVKADFNIPPQPLSSALKEFGLQSGYAVLATPADATAKVSQGVTGATDVEAALTQILSGSGLSWRRAGDTFLIVQAGEGGTSPQDASAGDVEALIVTAQKKDEDIQDVPIAISAFTQKSLDAQKIEGGFDLLKAIPNVVFSKTNFSGYNFSIRGIGTQAVSATTDPAVAVSFNNTTLIVNRLFEQEYVDVERVEVLRGPQGTLYGRNATSGVINVISAKPSMGDFFGELKLEGGNFNAQRLRGHVNVPVGETFAVRGAFAATKRDGYGYNEFDGSDVDNRDLWTARVTVAFEPNERFRSYFLWERFKEDDERVRTSKQLCHNDPTPTEVGGISLERNTTIDGPLLSQGCVGGSLYADEAFGTVNGASLPYVTGISLATDFGFVFRNDYGAGFNPYYDHGFSPGGLPAIEGEGSANAPCPMAGATYWAYYFDICKPNPYGGRMQSRDLRSISSEIKPEYRAGSDIFELALDFDVTDSLTLSSQSVYSKDEVWATQDYNRFAADSFWRDASENCGAVGPDIMSKYTANCSDDPDFGRGTQFPLQDLDADGVIDRANHPLKPGQTVDEDGWVRDAEGRRVGWFTYFMGPDGFCDPQLGCSPNLLVQDLSRAESEQFNQEFRLSSNFEGPVNFSLGTNYTKFETFNDYFVFSNAFTALVHIFNGPTGQNVNTGGGSTGFNLINLDSPLCYVYETDTDLSGCRHVDRNPINSIAGDGHNYFRSANPYELTSTAMFGELYWNITETLKLTAGARMTWDQKVFTPIPSQLLLADYRDLPFVGEGDPPPSGVDCSKSAQSGCP